MNYYYYLNLLLRITHFSLGFMFFGVIYYLGFFNSRILKNLDPAEQLNILPKVGVRYYAWLKWEGLFTIASGILLFLYNYYFSGGNQGIIYLISIGSGFLITSAIVFLIWIKVIPLHQSITENAGSDPQQLKILFANSRGYTELFNYLGILIIILMVIARL